MIIIESPNTRPSERDYILGVILGEFLGLDWQRVPSARTDTRITLQGHAGEILLPDTLFQTRDADWLTHKSLPTQPLPTWETTELGLPITLVNTKLPVIYGCQRAEAIGDRPEAIGQRPEELPHSLSPIAHRLSRPSPIAYPAYRLPLDLFGSAFFMLSRYEEIIKLDRDERDRFPATASLAYQEGFLDRPIIDEYVEVLWAVMTSLWPGLERKKHEGGIFVTCDVDSLYQMVSPYAMVRGLAADLLKRGNPKTAIKNLHTRLRARRGDFSGDPYLESIDWMMDVNERAGNRVAFYFIAERTHPLDGHYNLDEPIVRSLLRRIHERGHEIGIHPGYNTYRHPEAMARSATRLRRVLEEEGIEQPRIGGRQHYLRWESPTTARLWDENGLDYDSTLSFADRAGFRCGTCFEFPMFDAVRQRPLRLRERPLIVMECSVIAERYLGLGYSDEALAMMQDYQDICHQMGGKFTLLWHNSHFTTREDQHFYQELLKSTGRKVLT